MSLGAQRRHFSILSALSWGIRGATGVCTPEKAGVQGRCWLEKIIVLSRCGSNGMVMRETGC